MIGHATLCSPMYLLATVFSMSGNRLSSPGDPCQCTLVKARDDRMCEPAY